MMVDKLSSVNPLNNLQNTRRTNVRENVYSAQDSIDVSDEAKLAAETYYLDQIAKETPDVREDLVASIKQKIKDPNYLNAAVVSMTADKIMAAYGL